jgi:hypothetical protein
MVTKSINRRSVFAVLEVAFLGFLCWVVLSGILTGPDNSVQANSLRVTKQDKKQAKKAARKHKKSQARWAPTEGVPETRNSAPSLNVVAANGTTVACTTFDFAGGATQGFTVVPQFGTPLALWHGANAVCRAFLTGHSTPYTFYYGQDATCNYNTGARNAADLISPPISLAGKFAPFTVSFNYLLFVEGGGFDSTFVDLSTNNGATWTQFLSKANMINDNQWHNIVSNVTALVGAATSIRLRYRFDSVDNIANSTTGWHVDDISVCGEDFNFCIQDDKTKDFIRINTVTGHYISQQCSTGFMVEGFGTVTTNGCLVTVQENTTNRFNSVTVNTCTLTANGQIRTRNGLSIVAYNIVDSNTTNNTCTCP